MFELLHKLFIGHNHKWIERSEHRIVDSNGGTDGVLLVLRCEICGKMKNHKIQDRLF